MVDIVLPDQVDQRVGKILPYNSKHTGMSLVGAKQVPTEANAARGGLSCKMTFSNQGQVTRYIAYPKEIDMMIARVVALLPKEGGGRCLPQLHPLDDSGRKTCVEGV